MTLDEVKRRAVLDALARHRGNKTLAAAELGVSVKAVYNWLARWRRQGVVTRDWHDSLAGTEGRRDG